MAHLQPRRPRNIVILCDGTGLNGQRDSAKGKPITNIWRLYQAIQPQQGDIIEYFPGVGAYNDEVTAMDLLALTFGHTAVILIRKIYTTIAGNYKDGDSISLFGYSRGAFIARKVASLIGALGLITNEAEFKQYWEGLEHKLPGNRSAPRPPNPRVVPISCLGVWDTVGKLNAEYQRAVRPRAIREELNLLTLPDNDLPEIVQSALHVVAYHENRKLFNVTLFDANDSDKQLCKQTLFPGSHSDVGGGVAPKHGRNILPDVTLDWMLRNMPQAIQVTTKEKLESDVPSWYPINSAFHDSPLWKRIPDKLYQREHLPTRYGLFRHRTLLGLPSPKSPHLLKHMWREWEHFNSPEEEANGPPAAKSLMRRITDKAKSSMTPTWDRPALPLTPESPTFPAGTSRSADLQLPQQRRSSVRSRLDSSTTNQTDYTTDTLDTVSTPRTSLASVDIPLEAQAWLFANGPESPSNPVRTSLLPIAEDAHPVTEKTEKPRLGAEGGLPTPPETPNRIGPVTGRPAPTEPVSPSRRAVPGRAGAQALPAPVQGRPSPAQIPTVSAGPAAQARPGPAPVSPAPTPTRPGPAQARPAPAPVAPAQVSVAPGQVRPGLVRVHPPVTQVGSAVPAVHTPAQAGRAPVQAPPGPAQDYPAAPARPAPAQAGSPVPASRAPTQAGPAAQVRSVTPAGPAPAQGRPGPAQVPLGPVLAQVPVGPVVQARPGPAQSGPAPAQAHPDRPAPVQAHPPVPRASSAVPANHNPAQAGRTPAQTGRTPAQSSRAPAQADPSIAQASSAAPTGLSPGRAGHTPAQTGRGSVQAPHTPALAGPAPAPDRPSPAQAYPSAAQASSAVPANHTFFQGSFAPAQVHPSSVQAYPAAQVGPAVPAEPAPASARPAPAQAYPSTAQFGSAALASRTPSQVSLVPIQASPAQSPRAPAQAYPSGSQGGPVVLAGPAPARASPGYAQAGPGPIQAYPSVAQVGPGVPTSRAPAQAFPAAQTYPSTAQVDPAFQSGRAARFPTAAQGYPTGSVGSTIRNRSAAQYSPDIQARLDAIQTRPTVGAHPTSQAYLTAQSYPTAPVGYAAQARTTAYVQPNRPRQKKGVMQKIMSFFCCGSSGQMIG